MVRSCTTHRFTYMIKALWVGNSALHQWYFPQKLVKAMRLMIRFDLMKFMFTQNSCKFLILNRIYNRICVWNFVTCKTHGWKYQTAPFQTNDRRFTCVERNCIRALRTIERIFTQFAKRHNSVKSAILASKVTFSDVFDTCFKTHRRK